jgi:hypothetical protein
MTVGPRGRVQVTFDCRDAIGLARFWASALRYPPPDVERLEARLRADGVPDEDLDKWCVIGDPTGAGPRVFFQAVPEPKTSKNRVHLDVRIALDAPSDRSTIDEEAERLVALGASKVREVVDGDGYFVVLQDPEGNEFCID